MSDNDLLDHFLAARTVTAPLVGPSLAIATALFVILGHPVSERGKEVATILQAIRSTGHKIVVDEER